jgi:Flp pilus assembly secretin CpaC
VRSIRHITAVVLLACGLASAQNPQQVNLSVKIIEFQTTKGVETGLSAYYKQRLDPQPWGAVAVGRGAISAGDITFPTPTNAALTVFLDQITNSYGEFELVLQALVDENRAFILSHPKTMVKVGEITTPAIIQTVQEIPYETTTVIGATAVQSTSFRPTGVMLSAFVPTVLDDDGDPDTTDDTYIQLALTAQVDEEGQRITVALDDLLGGAGGVFSQSSNAIRVPEFVSRMISTTVWVRHGQVLILGGLFRNTKSKSLSTLPWLAQGQVMLNGVLQKVIPFAIPDIPITSALGSQTSDEGRRELVFLIKAELWKPSFTVAGDVGSAEDDAADAAKKRSPAQVLTGVLEGISEIPQGIADSVSTENPEDNVSSSLGDN